MKDIDRLIAHKEAAIAWLQDEIKALKRARKIVEGVSKGSATPRPGEPRGVKVGGAPPGNQEGPGAGRHDHEATAHAGHRGEGGAVDSGDGEHPAVGREARGVQEG